MELNTMIDYKVNWEGVDFIDSFYKGTWLEHENVNMWVFFAFTLQVSDIFMIIGAKALKFVPRLLNLIEIIKMWVNLIVWERRTHAFEWYPNWNVVHIMIVHRNISFR